MLGFKYHQTKIESFALFSWYSTVVEAKSVPWQRMTSEILPNGV